LFNLKNLAAMKPVITVSLILLFAGNIIAQDAPQPAPAAGHKAVAQDRDKKDKDKEHHRHHHDHKDKK